MSMKIIRSILIPVCLATVLCMASALAENRPNIVLFLADDMGYGELGCYGNADAITPNLDRFAAEGLRLTDCHAASSVCSPARSSLLTGRTPFRNGVFTCFSKQGMTPAMLVSGISTDFSIHQINHNHPIMGMPGGLRHKTMQHQAMHFQIIL